MLFVFPFKSLLSIACLEETRAIITSRHHQESPSQSRYSGIPPEFERNSYKAFQEARWNPPRRISIIPPRISRRVSDANSLPPPSPPPPPPTPTPPPLHPPTECTITRRKLNKRIRNRNSDSASIKAPQGRRDSPWESRKQFERIPNLQ